MQAFLFSGAIEFKEQAFAYLKKFDLENAANSLILAKEIDPYLTDLDLMEGVCQFAQMQGAKYCMSASKAARLWHAADRAHNAGMLDMRVYTLLRQLLADWFIQRDSTNYGFCTSNEKVIHRGVCYLILKRWQEAYQELLTLVTTFPEYSLPVHWGYLGDAAFILNYWKEANLGYLYLLFSAPQTADLATFKHRKIRAVLNMLIVETQDIFLARAYWPFHTWLKGLINFPHGNSFLLPNIQNLNSLAASARKLERTKSLRQFSFCLYIDQSGLQDNIGFDARTEMQALEPELFAQYLAEIDRRSKCDSE